MSPPKDQNSVFSSLLLTILRSRVTDNLSGDDFEALAPTAAHHSLCLKIFLSRPERMTPPTLLECWSIASLPESELDGVILQRGLTSAVRLLPVFRLVRALRSVPVTTAAITFAFSFGSSAPTSTLSQSFSLGAVTAHHVSASDIASLLTQFVETAQPVKAVDAPQSETIQKPVSSLTASLGAKLTAVPRSAPLPVNQNPNKDRPFVFSEARAEVAQPTLIRTAGSVMKTFLGDRSEDPLLFPMSFAPPAHNAFGGKKNVSFGASRPAAAPQTMKTKECESDDDDLHSGSDDTMVFDFEDQAQQSSQHTSPSVSPPRFSSRQPQISQSVFAWKYTDSVLSP